MGIEMVQLVCILHGGPERILIDGKGLTAQLFGAHMIDKKRIETEADAFFEWPTKDRTYVTRTSMLIFAGVIAEMVRTEAMRGGFICGKCSLRKDADKTTTPDF